MILLGSSETISVSNQAPVPKKEREKKYLVFLRKILDLARSLVVHTFDPRLREAEAGRSLSSRTAWSTECVPEQARLLENKGNLSFLPTPPRKTSCLPSIYLHQIYIVDTNFINQRVQIFKSFNYLIMNTTYSKE